MVLKVIKERRSIRKYSKKQIKEKYLKEILKAGQFAPNGRNIKEEKFIVVRDKILLEKLSKFKKSAADFLVNANAGIVVIGDRKKNDLWIENCSLAAGYMMLQAAALGIGSCWVEVRLSRHNPHAEEDIRKILNIPSNFGVLCILSLGYSREKIQKHTEKELDKNKIHYNKF